MQPYLRRDRSFLLPMTLSMGVAAWCQQNPAAVSPDFISDVLMNLANCLLYTSDAADEL